MTAAPAEPHRVERWYLKHSILLGIFVALLGCGYSDGHVYKRFRSLECSSGVFNRSVPNSARCCDEESDWVCTAAYDAVTAALSSAWAWALPLAPLGMRALGGGLGSLLKSEHWRRLGVYIAVFSYRTLVLYRLLNVIEGFLQPSEFSNHSCWYKELTARCKDAFDFSDHVVLMLVHYCAPAAVELGHALRSLREGGKADVLPCLAAATSSLALFASAFRALFFTSIYFHTAAEIVVAALVVLLLFCLPALHLLRRAPALLGPRT